MIKKKRKVAKKTTKVAKKEAPIKVEVPIGRPSDYTQELADRICAELAEGKSLRSVCRAEDMPDKSTVFRWLRTNESFRDQYAIAKQESTEAHQDVIEELGDEAIEEAKRVDPKSSNAVVSAYKLKADNIKWVMSKMKPKKYGEALDLTTKGGEIKSVNIINYGDKPDNPTV